MLLYLKSCKDMGAGQREYKNHPLTRHCPLLVKQATTCCMAKSSISQKNANKSTHVSLLIYRTSQTSEQRIRTKLLKETTCIVIQAQHAVKCDLMRSCAETENIIVNTCKEDIMCSKRVNYIHQVNSIE